MNFICRLVRGQHSRVVGKIVQVASDPGMMAWITCDGIETGDVKVASHRELHRGGAEGVVGIVWDLFVDDTFVIDKATPRP
jgi:hypothetical protein